MSKVEYKNMIAFHPGYYLEEILEEYEMTQEEFARRIGTTGKTLSLLLNGQSSVTKEMALKLSAVTGISAETFINLQNAYDFEIAKMNQQKELDEQIHVLQMIDYSYFVKNNFLPPAKTWQEKIKHLCPHLKVSNLCILKEKDLLATYRTTVSDVTEKNVVNANVWLQTALNIGLTMKVSSFDEKKFKAGIPEIRKLTVLKPVEFMPLLKKIFADCGVAFVVLPSLRNCGVNGVVKWYDRRAVLAINDRFATTDSFWFSLFHEIRHVLQKRKTKTIINGQNIVLEIGDAAEAEADEFARETLISSKAYNLFIRETAPFYTKEAILKFAKEQGIHPGIVVGRLCYDERIPYGRFKDLREKLVFEL